MSYLATLVYLMHKSFGQGAQMPGPTGKMRTMTASPAVLTAMGPMGSIFGGLVHLVAQRTWQSKTKRCYIQGYRCGCFYGHQRHDG